MELIMSILGFSKMKYVDVYFDVYGDYIDYNTILFDFHKTNKDIIHELSKRRSETSISRWRISKETTVYKFNYKAQ